MKNKHDGADLSEEMKELMEADQFASEMDDMMLDMAELNPELCPPDKRYVMQGREAWVYEHGNICELVFVTTE